MVYTTVKSALTSCPSVSAHFFDNMEVSPGSPWPPSPLGVRLQHVILYSGKLSREKTSQFCGYSQKLSPQNLGCSVLWRGKSEQSMKVFSVKIVFFISSQKFSPSSFPLYGTYRLCLTNSSRISEKWTFVPRPFSYCLLSSTHLFSNQATCTRSCFNCK